MTCQRICRIAEAVQMNASGHKHRKYTDSRRQYPFRKLHPQAHKTPQAHQRADHCADQRERALLFVHSVCGIGIAENIENATITVEIIGFFLPAYARSNTLL